MRFAFTRSTTPAILAGAFLVGSLLLAPALAHADATTQPTTRPAAAADFMRYVDNGSTGGRLETADAAYVNNGGAVVHLVAAVHIGEKAYYQSLAREFEKRDAVLYEMVKPKDTPMSAPGEPTDRPASAISQLQRFMKDSLNLEFQLDQIDYTRPNFVHADLDAETFQKLQEDRGETFEMLFIKQLMKAFTQPSADGADAQADPDKTLEDLVKTITRPDPERQVKRMLAQQMTHMEADALGLGDPSSSVLVGERNKAAIAKLKETLANGKKDIAIFYGAAHMPDMSSRLAELGFRPVATEWRTAWDLTIRADQPSAVESVLMELVHAMDDPQQ